VERLVPKPLFYEISYVSGLGTSRSTFDPPEPPCLLAVRVPKPLQFARFHPMKKIFGFGLLLVLILVVGAYITLQYFLGGIVKKGVNEYAPRITQTKVELQGAHISPFSGVGELNGLSVGNPQGWSGGDAFRLGKVKVGMEPYSVFKDTIVINELTIDQPEFLYETRLVASNIGDLLKNIEQSIGKSAEAKTKEGKPIKLIVKKLSLTNGKVTVGAVGTTMALPLPTIDMADIGVAEGGVTPAQLAYAVMKNVTATVVAAATQAIGKGGIGGTAGATLDQAKQVGEAIKGIFGSGQKKPAPAPPQPK
jgi:hypothetical protein